MNEFLSSVLYVAHAAVSLIDRVVGRKAYVGGKSRRLRGSEAYFCKNITANSKPYR